MIDGVGKSGTGAIGTGRAEKGANLAPAAGPAARGADGAVQSAVLGLVSGGAPVDSMKVAAIRNAIAQGRYPVDANRIAERMIALDLPQRD